MIWNRAIAHLASGFERAAELSDGQLFVIGEGESCYLTNHKDFVTKTVGEYIHQGYYDNWPKMLREYVHHLFTPVALLRLEKSVMSLIDNYEQLGLSVINPHRDNISAWKNTCDNYRAQVTIYLSSVRNE